MRGGGGGGALQRRSAAPSVLDSGDHEDNVHSQPVELQPMSLGAKGTGTICGVEFMEAGILRPA